MLTDHDRAVIVGRLHKTMTGDAVKDFRTGYINGVSWASHTATAAQLVRFVSEAPALLKAATASRGKAPEAAASSRAVAKLLRDKSLTDNEADAVWADFAVPHNQPEPDRVAGFVAGVTATWNELAASL